MSEEDYIDDEYIQEDNDPYSVYEVTAEDLIIDNNEQIIEHEKILYSLDARSDRAMNQHDIMMGEKVLDSLRKGKLK